MPHFGQCMKCTVLRRSRSACAMLLACSSARRRFFSASSRAKNSSSEWDGLFSDMGLSLLGAAQLLDHARGDVRLWALRQDVEVLLVVLHRVALHALHAIGLGEPEVRVGEARQELQR